MAAKNVKPSKESFLELEMDEIVDRIDEQLCMKNIPFLKNLAVVIGIKQEQLEEKRKHFIKGLITKYYEAIIQETDSSKEEKRVDYLTC